MRKVQVRKSVIYICLLLLAGIGVYYPVFGHQFLTLWDDQWVVMNVYTEGGISWRNLWVILTEFYHGQYAPFNEYFYLILYNLSGGYNPVAFHAASICLHLANILWVYVLLRKILSYSHELSSSRAELLSFLAALIFAIHPFNVESVAWMSASKILVYAFFYFWATYTLLIYMDSGKKRYYLYTLLLFLCSFLGKEQAVTFPVWICLLYWIAGRNLQNRKPWLEILPFFLLSVLAGLLTLCSQWVAGGGDLSGEASYPFWQRVIYACYTFIEYFLKCVLPVKLSYLYPFPSLPDAPLPGWLLIYPTLLLIAGAALWRYLHHRFVLSCLLFFLIHIGVALHLISLSRFAVVADRYAYVASVAIASGIAYGGMYLYEHFNRRRHLIIVLSVCYILSLGIYANVRTRVWYNTDTLKKEIRHLLKQRSEYKQLKNLER